MYLMLNIKGQIISSLLSYRNLVLDVHISKRKLLVFFLQCTCFIVHDMHNSSYRTNVYICMSSGNGGSQPVGVVVVVVVVCVCGGGDVCLGDGFSVR